MDDFIRRQYTYRKFYPNPLLKVERVWKELFYENEADTKEEEGSELGDVEEVEEHTVITWLELTIEDRLDVLLRLCEWQLHSEKFRERVGVTTELQASLWRIEPIGSDALGQIYYFLDDGRLYRCTDPAKSIDNAKQRSKKRKRDVTQHNGDHTTMHIYDDWKCIASTYAEWQAVLLEFEDPEDAAEDQLLQYLRDEAIPYIEGIEQERKAKAAALQAKADRIEAERIKELLRMEMMATRKRSSRIANLDEKREAERKKWEEEKKEQEMLARLEQAEKEKEKGMPPIRQTREARIRERELRLYAQRDASRSSQEAETDVVEVTSPPIVADLHAFRSLDNGRPQSPLSTVAGAGVHTFNVAPASASVVETDTRPDSAQVSTSNGSATETGRYDRTSVDTNVKTLLPPLPHAAFAMSNAEDKPSINTSDSTSHVANGTSRVEILDAERANGHHEASGDLDERRKIALMPKTPASSGVSE